MPAEQDNVTRVQAVQDVASAIVKAAGVAMLRHGDDQHGHAVAILAAGFATAIQAIGEDIDSRLPAAVRDILGEPRPFSLLS